MTMLTSEMGHQHLATLREYDHWDPSSSGAYAQILSLPPSVDLANNPIPNLIGLQCLTRAQWHRGYMSEHPPNLE